MRKSRRTGTLAVLGIAVAVAAVIVVQSLVASTPAASMPNPAATPSPTARVTATPRPSASPTPAETPTPTLSPILKERFTMVILGTDRTTARAANGEAPRTDAILVVSVSEDQSSVAMISVPRDTVDVPLADGGTWSRKINAIYAEAGVMALRSGLETMLELEIHRHVALDMDSFRALVEMVGGIEVEIEHDIVDPTVELFIPGGRQHLDAAEALAYARHRAQGGDYARADRHQRVVLGLVAVATALDDVELLLEIHDSVPSLDTDLSTEELPILLELARRADDAELRSVVLKAPEFALFEGIQGDRGWILVPDLEAIRAEVERLTR